LLSLALCAIFIGLLVLPNAEVSAKRSAVPAELSLTVTEENTIQASAATGGTDETSAAPVDSTEHSSLPEDKWQEVVVKKGDNPSVIFSRMGLTARDLYELTHSSKEAAKLTRLYPGEKLAFALDEKGEFAKLRHIKNPLESTLYIRTSDGYQAEKEVREPAVHQVYRQATLENSLFLAGQEAGLSHNIIMELANIFGGVIDFILDPRSGDTFTVLYEELYLDGEKIGDGNILAAQYTNRGTPFMAYRFIDSSGEPGYYNEEGESMRKAFLRAPLDFTRISSGFNLRRKHPIHKKIRAHRGIDYAAPRGTPVFAAGDGRVTKAGYSRANGNYVFIQHGQQYTTKYLHLHKRNVKQGQRVKQRQIIGQVGSTGYATGPHLHYEFLVNGVHRNPRTIVQKLPKAKSIGEQEMGGFLAEVTQLQGRLATYQQAYTLATASNPDDTSIN
jgi:murein DD-endopeptidase MepM/ murein hydrolase activator NlpD